MNNEAPMRGIQSLITIFLAAVTVMIVILMIKNDTKISFDSAFGAFFGALCAFLFERWRDRRDKLDENYAAVLRARMILKLHANSLENIRRQLERFRNPLNRNDLPLFRFTKDSDCINLDSLTFLLNEKAPDIVYRLYLADKAYHNVAAAIDERNEFYSRIQPADISEGSRRFQLDKAQAIMLTDLTNIVFDCLDKGIPENENAIKILGEAARDIFPKRRILPFKEM